MAERGGGLCAERTAQRWARLAGALVLSATLLPATPTRTAPPSDPGAAALVRGPHAVHRERSDGAAALRGVARGGRRQVRAIVVLHDDVPDPVAVSAELARACRGKRRHLFRRALTGFSIELPATELVRLAADPRVRYVDEDRVLAAAGAGPPDGLPPGLSRIDGEFNATASIDGAGPGVDVDIAVLDTGIASAHPDLDVYRAVNFVQDTTAEDVIGHGTHVGGIAAARDDGQGVVGVAPGARLWSVKVLNDYGWGVASDIIAGIDWVTEHADEIDVANMSLGGTGQMDDGDCGRTNGDALHEAICNSVAAGVVYVVAAGNNGGNAATKIPASYDEVITVSAVVETDGLPGGLGEPNLRGPDDTLANFSNFGADVDVAAPGVDVRSTWPGGGTEVKSGTSMAAPHVAGAAALWIASHGKPTDAAGTRAVRDALIAVGYAQNGADGFDLDRDSAAEPLVSSRGVDPLDSGGSRLYVKAFARERFNTYFEEWAPLRVMVRGAAYERLRTLGTSAFQVLVDGAAAGGPFHEVQPGIYEGAAALAGLAEGTHALRVVVSDRTGLVGEARREFVTESFVPTPAVKMNLISDRLTYSAYFGSAGVELTADVHDELGRPISGLGPADFTTTPLGGETVAGQPFEETAEPGVYRSVLLITGLPDGPHRLQVGVEDARGLGVESTLRYRSVDAIVLGNPQLRLATDRPVYDAFHGQDQARVTFSISGMQQQPFSGIGSSQLELLIDGVVRSARFEETPVPGDYRAVIDLSGLPDGLHRLSAVYRIGAQQAFVAQAELHRRVLNLRW